MTVIKRKVIKKRRVTKKKTAKRAASGGNLVLKLSRPIEGLFNSVSTLFDDMGEQIVGQSTMLDAMRYALVLGHHVMIVGDPGEAKSKAAKLLLSSIGDAQFFDAQFTTGTQVEEIFGPMDLKAWRDESNPRIHYRTEGYLPTAHVALLDELFRGPANIHSVLFRLLNERVFKQGVDVVDVPLRTAIATTNFIPDDPELQAYFDRFLFQVEVSTLEKAQQLAVADLAMTQFEEDGEQLDHLMTDVDLTGLEKLRKYILGIKVPKLIKELVTELHSHFAVDRESRVSTRRLVQSFLVAKYIAAEADCFGTRPDPGALQILKNVWCNGPKVKSLATRFDNAYLTVIGTWRRKEEEREKAISSYEDDIDWDVISELPSKVTSKTLTPTLENQLVSLSNALGRFQREHIEALRETDEEKADHVEEVYAKIKRMKQTAEELALPRATQVRPGNDPFASAMAGTDPADLESLFGKAESPIA